MAFQITDFLRILSLFHHFEGQRYRRFYSKNHRHYCDLNANQVCYTFRYVLSYFHNENELTELKRFISGRNSIFVYKLPMGPVTWQNHNDISNFASKFQISVKFLSNFIFLYFKFRGKFHKNLARLTLS